MEVVEGCRQGSRGTEEEEGGKEREQVSFRMVCILSLTRLLVFLIFLHLGTRSFAFSTYS